MANVLQALWWGSYNSKRSTRYIFKRSTSRNHSQDESIIERKQAHFTGCEENRKYIRKEKSIGIIIIVELKL